MTHIEQLLDELSQSTFSLRDFFLLLCPLITNENVEDVFKTIPLIHQLAFRRNIAYESGVGEIYEMGADTTRTLDGQFRDGLQILKQHLESDGPLQFGDHLLMQRDRLESLCERLSNAKGDAVESHLAKSTRQLALVEELLECHSPTVLRSLANQDS